MLSTWRAKEKWKRDDYGYVFSYKSETSFWSHSFHSIFFSVPSGEHGHGIRILSECFHEKLLDTSHLFFGLTLTTPSRGLFQKRKLTNHSINSRSCPARSYWAAGSTCRRRVHVDPVTTGLPRPSVCVLPGMRRMSQPGQSR